MDPTTIIGLICNILQVADYAAKVVSKGNEIIEAGDGALVENRDAETWATELVLRNQKLTEAIRQNEESGDSDDDDKALEALGRECNGLAQQLISRLSALRTYTGSSKFKSIKVAFKATMRKDELNSIGARLQGFQGAINNRMLQSLTLRQKVIYLEQQRELGLIDENGRQILSDLQQVLTDSQQNRLFFNDQFTFQRSLLLEILDTIRNVSPRPTGGTAGKRQSPAHYTGRRLSLPVQEPQRSIFDVVQQGDENELLSLLKATPSAVASLRDEDESPLHTAVLTGKRNIVKVLLDRGADVNARDTKGRTPLHLAAKVGSVPVVRILLKRCADPEVRDRDKRTALQLVPRDSEIAWVLKNGHSIDARDHCQDTALIHFAKLGDVRTSTSLLRQGADLDITNARGFSALHEAAHYDHTDICELLLDHDSNIDARDTSDRQGTALGISALCGNVSTTAFLIKRGADVNLWNTWLSPLSDACKHGLEDVAILLIENGADLTTPDDEHFVPMERAAWSNMKRAIAKMLVTGRVDVNSSSGGRGGWSALHESSSHGRRDIVELLLQNFAATNLKIENGNFPLWLAAEKGHAAVVELLLRHNQDDLETKGQWGLTPLAEACEHGHTEVIVVLLAYHADVNARDNDKYTPMCRAAMRGHSSAVKLLLDHGADINAQNKHGWTSVMEAACRDGSNYREILKELLRRGADPDIMGRTHPLELDVTALTLAASSGRNEHIAALALFGQAKIDLQHPLGITALFAAVENRRSDTVALLLSLGADPDIASRAGSHRCPPLIRAAQDGLLDIVRLLLNQGKASPFATDVNGWTALHAAAANGHTAIVKMLIRHGADKGIKDTVRERTPLDLAQGHVAIVNLLG